MKPQNTTSALPTMPVLVSRVDNRSRGIGCRRGACHGGRRSRAASPGIPDQDQSIRMERRRQRKVQVWQRHHGPRSVRSIMARNRIDEAVTAMQMLHAR